MEHARGAFRCRSDSRLLWCGTIRGICTRVRS
jgi:hypothetical protein